MQTLSGAISTGTHGTGHALGGLATQVAGLELLTADGSLLQCSATEPRRPSPRPGSVSARSASSRR